uniref:Uncharacterized protein n=1 Tax=Timema cristinae TaxID=61476 RepID=A0A7R9DF24_TIMCR|nr:unnamed protein product [Timema cristinae]
MNLLSVTSQDTAKTLGRQVLCHLAVNIELTLVSTWERVASSPRGALPVAVSPGPEKYEYPERNEERGELQKFHEKIPLVGVGRSKVEVLTSSAYPGQMGTEWVKHIIHMYSFNMLCLPWSNGDTVGENISQPPENELQKGGERVMSEHQLRVQRSLQKLNVPDWYKNSSAARTPEGFLLKNQHKEPREGWPGLSSKTTSLSSLGSTQSAATARSPTSHLLSPSPTPHVFTRWSTSRLNSNATSASTSPCGSTRSSFNYRQPYLGWRSQERLARPRTPAERLAAGLLPANNNPSSSAATTPELQPSHEDLQQIQQVPNLSEVRTSIKEVTSAIVHYVSGVRDGSGDSLRLSSRSSSPRGSGRLCWLESSFVGTRPLDSPETPADIDHQALDALDGRVDGKMYLELTKTPYTTQQSTPQQQQVNGEYLLTEEGKQKCKKPDLEQGYAGQGSDLQRLSPTNIDVHCRHGVMEEQSKNRDMLVKGVIYNDYHLPILTYTADTRHEVMEEQSKSRDMPVKGVIYNNYHLPILMYTADTGHGVMEEQSKNRDMPVKGVIYNNHHLPILTYTADTSSTAEDGEIEVRISVE